MDTKDLIGEWKYLFHFSDSSFTDFVRIFLARTRLSDPAKNNSVGESKIHGEVVVVILFDLKCSEFIS